MSLIKAQSAQFEIRLAAKPGPRIHSKLAVRLVRTTPNSGILALVLPSKRISVLSIKQENEKQRRGWGGFAPRIDGVFTRDTLLHSSVGMVYL